MRKQTVLKLAIIPPVISNSPNRVILPFTRLTNSPNPVILLLAKLVNSPHPVIRD